MFISGPRTSTLGSETGTTSCMLLAGQGGDHLTSSMIYHSSTVTCIPTAIAAGSTACFAGNLNACSSVNIGLNLRISTSTSAGNATDPAITTGGCTKVGVYFDGGCVGLGSGGNTLILTQTGKVGIGTQSPDYGNLSIYCIDNTPLSSSVWGTSTAAGVTVAVYNGSQCANSVAGLRLITRDSGASIWNIYNVSTGPSAGALAFGNGSGGTGYEKLRITDDGITCFACTVCIGGEMVVKGNAGSYNTHYFTTGASNVAKYIQYNASGTAINQIAADAHSYFNSGCNVGIGTSTPTYTLDVTGTARVSGNTLINSKLLINSSDTGKTPLLLNAEGNYATSGNMTTGFAITNTSFGRALNMGVYESGAYAWMQAAYINNADTTFALSLQPRGGNVGIGLTNPSCYYSNQLVVSAGSEGGITIANPGTTGAQYIMFADGTSGADRYRGYMSYNHTDNSMTLATDANTRFTITGTGITCFSCQICAPVAIFSGCVGIGTTSPSGILHLAGPTGAGSSTQLIFDRLGGYGGYYVNYAYESTYYTNGSTLEFRAGNALTQIRLASNNAYTAGNIQLLGGNVGIGATAPSSLLHICGAGTGAMLRIQNTSTVSGDQGPLIQFMSANQVGGQNFESGYIQSIWTNEGNGFGMRFATKAVDGSQVEHIRITSGGNVGIGTTDPNYKLRVEGTLYSLGTARFNGVVFSDCRLMVGVAGNDQTYASVFVGGALTSGTSQYALLLDPQLSGTTNYGVFANARIKASTSATNAYGVYIINNELLSGASVVNNYGLYIANQTNGSSVNYTLYSAGGLNYFGGNVGIGQPSPSFGLEVYSSAQTAITSNDTFGANFNIIFNRSNTGGTRNCFNFLADQNAAYLRTLDNYPMVFVTAGSDRARIAANGIACFACKPSFPGATLTCSYTCTYSSYTAGCWLGLFAGDNGFNGAYAFTVVGQFNLGGSGLYTMNFGTVPYIHKSDSIGSTNGNDSYWLQHNSSGHADNGALVCFRRTRFTGNTPAGNRTEFCMNVSYNTSFTATTYVLAWV
jgi:hypothetical protein